jgi:hypothetical protein
MKSRKHKPSALISVVGWELEHPKQNKDRHKEDNQQSKEDRDAGDAQLGFWCYSSRESENKEKRECFYRESDTSHFLFCVY